MKVCLSGLIVCLLAVVPFSVAATTHYVSVNSANPVSPYTSWATAATNIQNAINAAASGDTVLVTNGIYQSGSGINSSRIFVTAGLTVQSVNGPLATTILGIQTPGTINGSNAIRCAFLSPNSTLSGFTLENGATPSNTGIPSGGGVYCQSTNAVVTNCIITGNSCAYEGAGAWSGTLINCTLSGNTAQAGGGGAAMSALINCNVSGNTAAVSGEGGGTLFCSLTNCLITGNTVIGYGAGAYQSTLVNCTIISNTASSSGGGAQDSTLYNCISYYNSPDNGSSINNITNCCITPLPPSALGANNFTNTPGFLNLAGGNYRLQIGSACINAGNNSYDTSSTDLDGNPRIVGGTVDVGAYENSFTGAVHYVSLNSVNPVTPYSTWADAATNIQDAVNSASAGDFVVADSGIYTNGGIVMFGSETNRVVLTNGVTLLSLNGPQSTLIVGGLQMRGVYVSSNSFLDGFTVTNGQTRLTGDVVHEQSGGGIWCEPGGAVGNCIVVSNYAGSVANTMTARLGGGIYGGAISNCVITGNFGGSGGGAASNILWNCTLSNNMANLGGGAYGSALFNSVISSNDAYYNGTSGAGGGAYQCVTFNSTFIKNNTATGSGGGSYQGTNFNCLIVSNNANGGGGGTYQTTNYNCTISFNLSANNGGGAYGGWHYNCVVNGNSATNGLGEGGGVYVGNLVNCTVVGNVALSGGGINNSQSYNSIIYYNNATTGSNYTATQIMDYCCTAPNPGGIGCITNDPSLLDWTNGFFQLKCGSPCIDAGFTNAVIFATTNDIRGLPRPVDGNNDGIAAFDIGAYEYTPAVDLIPIIRSVSGYTNFATGYAVTFAAEQGGCANFYWWDFGDGSPTITNQNNVSHSWSTPGTYNVTLSAFFNSGLVMSSTFPVQVVSAVYYVNPNSPAAIAPYTSWATASHTIQPAIAASTTPGRLVLVTNGTYQTPSSIVYGSEYNLAVMTNPVIVESVNGPTLTTLAPLQGRCAYVGSNSFLSGFTLRNGHTLSSGDVNKEESGGGAWCEPGGMVSNCVIAACLANQSGGGAYQGTFYSCTFSNNSASQYGGGTFLSTLNNCSVSNNSAQFGGGVCMGAAFNSLVSSNLASYAGGGAYSNALFNCVLSANLATSPFTAYGGGAYICHLTNCTVTGNSALSSGGGAYGGSLIECVVAGNSAGNGGGVMAFAFAGVSILSQCTIYGNSAVTNGGGLYSADNSPLSYLFATNCIVFGNTAPTSSNYFFGNTNELILAYCCTAPLPTYGPGNIASDPLLVNPANGDFHLQSTSPCINSGLNSAVVTATDLDGNPRIVGGTVDIGAYEYQTPTSIISYAWLQEYGLPTDGSADFIDSDGDGMNNWQEWIAGTNPTNAASVLQMTSASNSVSGVTVTWQSVSGINYFIQRSTNLSVLPAFAMLQTNLVGQASSTSYTDTTATNGGQFFYRVGVQ